MKKEMIAVSVLGLIFVVLGVISLLVILSRGNPSIVRQKIKIGALILTITSLLAGCGSPNNNVVHVDCYAKPVEADQMSLVCNHYKDGRYIFHITTGDTIRVNVSNRQGTQFSYGIIDSTGKLAHMGVFISCDGEFNSQWEELSAPLNMPLPEGKYTLAVYNTNILKLPGENNRKATYPIVIKNK
jgi:hypothetical protein